MEKQQHTSSELDDDECLDSTKNNMENQQQHTMTELKEWSWNSINQKWRYKENRIYGILHDYKNEKYFHVILLQWDGHTSHQV